MTEAITTPLSIQVYQNLAQCTEQRPQDGLAFSLLGLFGETGSLLSEAKKKHRDSASYVGYHAAVSEELGDVLWYLAAVAARGKLPLAELALEAVGSEGDPAVIAFTDLQPDNITPQPTSAFERTLLRLAGEVGLLISAYESGSLEARPNDLRMRLVGVFKAVVCAANEAGVGLERAARANIDKIFDRWPRIRSYPPLFDDGFPVAEQLPRKLVIDIFERGVSGKSYVFQRCNGLNIGNRLTDNILNSDDYRFHDVFHYAYAAVLGWSPVVRALLRLKRKSQPIIDEAEDGARAIVIEEGITTWIFGQAKDLNFFAGMQSPDLSLTLLKNVRQFVRGHEVARCPLWAWEEAILQGYAAFRFLREKRRGVLRLDLNARTLAIDDLP